MAKEALIFCLYCQDWQEHWQSTSKVKARIHVVQGNGRSVEVQSENDVDGADPDGKKKKQSSHRIKCRKCKEM